METLVDNILNVTLLEPKFKHPTIFAHYDELKEGESLTIHNDHDPKPLYYQLLGERGNVFTWEYLEEGPEWWKVKISKRVLGEDEETIGQIAANDLRKVEVFKKYGLDFCCGGKKTLKEACAEKGLDAKKVEQDLLQADKMPASRALPYNDWSLDFLADYIVNTHHTYVNKTLPEVVKYAQKVMEVHSAQHPELIEINELVKEVNTEFIEHMASEEGIVFPYIKELVKATKPVQHLGKLQNLIDSTEKEHEVVGGNLDKIQELTNNYTLPEDACASYTLLYRMLEELEDDTHVHILLENNILFPKAIQLENSL